MMLCFVPDVVYSLVRRVEEIRDLDIESSGDRLQLIQRGRYLAVFDIIKCRFSDSGHIAKSTQAQLLCGPRVPC